MNNTTISKDAIVIERVFDAPVDLIWQMWTQPEHFKNWYGPAGFSVQVIEMDVQVGGKHLFCMERQTPDGSMKMWLTGEYTDVVPNKRLVYTDSPSDAQGNLLPPSEYGMDTPLITEVRVLLEDLNGRTRMVMTHAGVSGDDGAAAGWEQALNKLAEYAGTAGSGG
jgi:uncharacterized protein YndB with AHSA1/START domain